MWVLAGSTPGKDTVWDVVRENLYCQLLRHKTVGFLPPWVTKVPGFFSGGSSSTPSPPNGEENSLTSTLSNVASSASSLLGQQRFRIVLKTQGWQVVAVASTEEEITKDWLWIEQNLLFPFTASPPEERAGILEFLRLTIESLVKKEQEEEKEKVLLKERQEFRSFFPTLSNEKFISRYTCALRQLFRQGTMYLTESYVCFSPTLLGGGERITLLFKEVTLISKSVYHFIDNSVLLKTISNPTEEHLFIFLNQQTRNDAYEILQQLWKMSLDRLLIAAESALEYQSPALRKYSRSTTSFVSSASASSPPSFPPSELPPLQENAATACTTSSLNVVPPATKNNALAFANLIRKKKRDEQRNKQFRLPPTECLVQEYKIQLVVNNWPITGNLYVTHNFFCYQSIMDSDVSADIKLVLPLTRISAITPIKQDIIKITMKGQRKKFFFLSTIRNEVNRVMVEVWQLVFSKNPSLTDETPRSSACNSGGNSENDSDRDLADGVEFEENEIDLESSPQGDEEKSISPLSLSSLSSASSLFASTSEPVVIPLSTAPLSSSSTTPSDEGNLTPRLRSPRGEISVPKSPRSSLPISKSSGSLHVPGHSRKSSSDGSPSALLQDGNKKKWWLSEEPCCPERLGVLLTDNNHFSKHYGDLQEERKKSWERYFRQCGNANDSMIEREDQLKKLVRKGIPDELRGVIWRFFSGSLNKKAMEWEVDYKTLQNDPGKENTSFLDDIEKDLYRSLPEHPFYHTDVGIRALRNVLVTYASFNPDVGYSQSMNLVVAVLLLFMSEEGAFWVLRSICEDIVPENYHHHMIGTVVDQSIFEELLSQHLPNLSSHLKNTNVPLNAITQPWFFSFFVGYVPLELALQIVDCFFFDGPSVLFSVGIAIFKHREAALLELFRPDQIISLIKQRIDNFTTLLQIAWNYMEVITKESIQDLRNAGTFKTIQEMEFVTKTSTIRKIQARTKFTAAEVQAIYDRFQLKMEEFHAKEIDYQLFIALASEFIPWITERFDFGKLLYQASSKKGVFDFVEFAAILSCFHRGSIGERFQVCFGLYENNGVIDKGDMYNILDVLIRLEGADVTLKDLNTFITMCWEKADHDQDGKVTLTEFAEEIVNKPILEIFICATEPPDWIR